MLCHLLRWLPEILTRLRHSLCGHKAPRMSRSEVCVCPPSILYFHPIASLANIAFTVSSSPDIAFTVPSYWITSLSPYHLNGWHRFIASPSADWYHFHRIAFLSDITSIVSPHCLTSLSSSLSPFRLTSRSSYHLTGWHHFYCITLLSDFTFTVSLYRLTSHSPYCLIAWHNFHRIALSDITFTVSSYCLTSHSPYHLTVWHHFYRITLMSDIFIVLSYWHRFHLVAFHWLTSLSPYI